MTLILPPPVTALLDRLTRAGHRAHVVGGCVRDLLRGVSPGDYDITTDALPEQMKMVFADCRTIDTGLRHGTVTLLYEGVPYELTTYRIDGAYLDSRHPDTVSYTRDLHLDLARRDFTVNAMAYHPATGLTDPFGGRADLAQRLVRAVGDPALRFAEDALRILRALRFAAVLDFTVEAHTECAMRAAAETLRHISAERVREELLKLLDGQAVGRVLLTYRPVLAAVLPELPGPDGLALTADAVTRLPTGTPLRLAALLQGTPDPAGTAARLRLDRRTAEHLSTLCAMAELPLPDTESQTLRYLSRYGVPACRDSITLGAAFAAARGRTEQPYRHWQSILERMLAEGRCYRLSMLAIDGEALAAHGIPRGKTMGRLLDALLEAVMAGEIGNTRQALLAHARRLAAAETP